jgi:hypothetical protein
MVTSKPGAGPGRESSPISDDPDFGACMVLIITSGLTRFAYEMEYRSSLKMMVAFRIIPTSGSYSVATVVCPPRRHIHKVDPSFLSKFVESTGHLFF